MHQTNDDWLYLKLYLGAAWDRIDHLIVDIGENLARLDGVAEWFFLRYVDESGPHLRIRAKPLAGARERLQTSFRELCKGRLYEISQYPPSDYRPVISMGDDETPAAPTGDLRVVVDTYEPEYDKFGGAAGMPIAEHLFRVSSEVACAILADEFAGRYSRKTIAPCAMDLAFRTVAPGEPAAAYWRQYATYWLGGETQAAEDWRERFVEKSDELASQRVPIVAAEAALNPAAVAQLERWRRALAEGVAAFRAAGVLDDLAPGLLAFQFCHLMNNRLGFYSLEEAYFATLLERVVPAGAAA